MAAEQQVTPASGFIPHVEVIVDQGVVTLRPRRGPLSGASYDPDLPRRLAQLRSPQINRATPDQPVQAETMTPPEMTAPDGSTAA